MLRTHKDREFIVTSLHICEFLFSSSTQYPGIGTEKMNSGVFPELGFCQENKQKPRDQGVEGVGEVVIQVTNV